MAIKSSGNPNPPLAFSEIETEFGSNSSRSLGRFPVVVTPSMVFGDPVILTAGTLVKEAPSSVVHHQPVRLGSQRGFINLFLQIRGFEMVQIHPRVSASLAIW